MSLIPSGVTRMLGRQLLVAKKQMPHILFGAGVAGVITSTVLACRATLKLGDTIDEIQENIDHSKAILVHHDQSSVVVDIEREKNQRLTTIYLRGGYEVAKLYGPSVLLGVASIGALTGSHVSLARRNAALTAAYMAVSEAYQNYRDRVRAEVGPIREIELYHGACLAEFEDDNGELRNVLTVDTNTWSPYAKLFDEYNSNWKKNAELNQYFVTCQQRWLNQRLNTRGHVFLNEAYEALGMEHTKAGAVVGWLLDQGGDNYIDFGVFEARNKDFARGIERSILLDFNVDGVIFDKI